MWNYIPFDVLAVLVVSTAVDSLHVSSFSQAVSLVHYTKVATKLAARSESNSLKEINLILNLLPQPRAQLTSLLLNF